MVKRKDLVEIMKGPPLVALSRMMDCGKCLDAQGNIVEIEDVRMDPDHPYWPDDLGLSIVELVPEKKPNNRQKGLLARLIKEQAEDRASC